jgi:hypothetical protein
MSTKKHSINLRKIVCNHAVEDNVTDGDDIYIYIQADAGVAQRIPRGLDVVHMEKGDIFYPANNGNGDSDSFINIQFDYEVLVMIWDQDFTIDPNTATFLVNHQFVAANPGVGSNYQMSDEDVSIELTNQDSANYSIVYNTNGCA